MVLDRDRRKKRLEETQGLIQDSLRLTGLGPRGSQSGVMGLSPLAPMETPKIASSTPAKTSGKSQFGDTGGFKPEFEARLNRLMNDAPGKLTINSGYRSVQHQERLWRNALKKYGDPEVADNWVARPPSAGGKGSNHTRGIAADLGYENDALKKWVHANAGKYGLKFPMSWEPWHIELA